ncbi:hypothetical protein ACS0TY_004197 [Phlomoides rotata]
MNQSRGNGAEDRILRETDETNKKQEHRIRNLETKVVQNVNLYFIFQAVILTSTTTTTAATSCRNWWIPFTLSLLAAIINLLSFWADMSKILKSREELDQNLSDFAFIKVYQMTIEELNRVLPGTPLNHEGGEIVRPKADSVSRWKRRLVAYFSVGVFVGFSAVIMYGCYRILCHPGVTKCVKLC